MAALEHPDADARRDRAPASGPEIVDPLADRIEQARVLAYQDPVRSLEMARRALAMAEAVGARAHEHRACWLIALAELRVGDADTGDAMLDRARAGFTALADAAGVRLCDEVRAIGLRRRGQLAACRSLLDEIDRRGVPPADAFEAFLAHNSRAITLKNLGLTDLTLGHFYSALDAAERLRWPGPRVVAAANLGGFHLDLLNLDDALTLSRRAQQDALSAGMAPIIGTATVNLIVIHYALGLRREARSLTEFLLANEARLLPGALQGYAPFIGLGFLAGGDLMRAETWLRSSDTHAHVQHTAADHGEMRAWVLARTQLEQGDFASACETVEAALGAQDAKRGGSPPFDQLELLRVAADAHERNGDPFRAMACLRRAQQVHEELVGRSARARYRALQAEAEFRQAQRERDEAIERERRAAEDRERLEGLNRQLQAQVQANEELQLQLREQGLRDGLTGLHNRRHLIELAPAAFGYARRKRQPLSLALIDVDGLRGVREHAGAAEVDRLLVGVADLLRLTCRSCDTVCRWGGDAFVLLMPDTTEAMAAVVLQRLQRGIAGLPALLQGAAAAGETGNATQGVLRASMGVVELDDDDEGLDDLLRRADAAVVRTPLAR